MVRFKCSIRLTVVLCALGTPAYMMAQEVKHSADPIDSRVDIYGGYGLFHPVNSTSVNGVPYQDVSNINATVSITGYFSRYFGLQAEGGYFQGSGEHRQYDPACTGATCNQLIYTLEGGAVVRFPKGQFVPFVHALIGGARQNGPASERLTWGEGLTLGGGLDWVPQFFHQRVALRLFQADYQYSDATNVVNQSLLINNNGFADGKINALKVTGGVVVRFGAAAQHSEMQLGCTADPVSVFPGDPVKITGSTIGISEKTKTFYTWTAKGTTVSGNGPEAVVNTNSLEPGEYGVVGHLTQGPNGRELASCSAPFTVKAFEPPTISCSANPNTATSGTDVMISTSGGSPQNRPLTYSYSSTGGELTSNGPTAKLSTAGLHPGSITVSCNVVDDLGHTAATTTTLNITEPVANAAAQTQSLCSLSFARDKQRPVRVDNEAKGCLDEVALALNQQTDAHLILVGNYTASERESAAAERTLNARQYLTNEKGIDPARIEVRIGNTPGKTVYDILVPAGAVFNDMDTHPFREGTVVRHGQPYGKPHP